MLRMTQPASSLAIRAAWYQPARRQLDLLFGSGRHYRYSNVPGDIAEQFARAASKGGFYNRMIRGHYACLQLDSDLIDAA